jgi:NCAIR mutase (PurE)-related protein
MNREMLVELLTKVKNDEYSVSEALSKIKLEPFQKHSHSLIDRHRAIRKGQPEVLYCQNKTAEQINDIISKMLPDTYNIIATRISKDKVEQLYSLTDNIHYNADSKIAIINKKELRKKHGMILVMTGGTSDIPVAEEAAVTAEAMGNYVERLYDVGVAGLHRLLSHLETIDRATVIIAVAGMEGALAGVVAGLNDKPVIAVPTSIGYGANFKGVSALLTMLNSCAGGISVVNIDNGFGAGYAAGLINNQINNYIVKHLENK